MKLIPWLERQFNGWPVWALKTFCALCIISNLGALYTLWRVTR